jgi:putative hydrolase of HD superfamily
MKLAGTEDESLFSVRLMMSKFRFICELDKLKSVFRRTLLLDGSRAENDAEHSWEMAAMALVLREYAEPGTDLLKVLKMLLMHDLIEIDAGDTFVYDAAAAGVQADRELIAANRIFGLLEEPERSEFHALWREFEDRITPEARFARALDRLQPLLHNYYTEGKVWQENRITAAQVRRVTSVIREGSRELGALSERMIQAAIAKGFLKSDE